MLYSELPVQHHYAMIGGTQFHYVEMGKGPLVLLIHGFPEMWWSWRLWSLLNGQWSMVNGLGL